MNFKFSRGEIAIVIGMFVVIITLNAWWRVKAMGASEARRQWDEDQRAADAGIDVAAFR
jgi:hypothetical protein